MEFYCCLDNLYEFLNACKHGWLPIESSFAIQKIMKLFGQFVRSPEMLSASFHTNFTLIMGGSQLWRLVLFPPGRNHSQIRECGQIHFAVELIACFYARNTSLQSLIAHFCKTTNFNLHNIKWLFLILTNWMVTYMWITWRDSYKLVGHLPTCTTNPLSL